MFEQINRRSFMGAASIAPMVGWSLATAADAAESGAELRIAPFRFDVTPPLGHSCCGGWIKPVEVVDDGLEAIGFVLLGAGKPIVLCAVDWTGIMNGAHVQWRKAIADAAGTTADRVAVQCVHQHNAPFACLEAQRIVSAYKELPHIVDVGFFRRCLDRARSAVQTAVQRTRPVTHIARGQGKVSKVASNRRVSRDAKGHILKMRGSSCRVPELIALPEGQIDPWVKTIAFYENDKKVVACHYYATHPMSYYADGRVSSDFAGLARKKRQADEPGCTHIYFTGCAGNVAAGKYNDGSKPARALLTQRLYDGIVASEKSLRREPVTSASWATAEMTPKPNVQFSTEMLEAQIANKKNRVVHRNRPSYRLAWMRRVEQQLPIVLSGLRVNDIRMLHFPAECFIEYQLRAQQKFKDGFVATAAYGDGGPWYIPVKEEYPNGGYEVSVAFCDPSVDQLLSQGMTHLLRTT